MEQSWWGSLPWTWQGKGGRLDAQDGRGHLTEGLLTLHNQMGDAGINVKKKKKNIHSLE